MALCVMTGWASLDGGPIALGSLQDRSLGTRVQSLEDPDGSLSVTDAERSPNWKQGQAAVLNFGLTRSTIWVRLQAHNDTRDTRWLLLQRVPLMDHLTVFEQRPDGSWERRVSGSARPFAEREIDHRYFVFPVEIPAGANQRFMLRLQNRDVMAIDLALTTPQRFYRETSSEYLFFGLYFGIMGVMVLYNLFVYISARDRSYRSYIFFVAIAALHAAAQNGFAFQFLWPDNPWLASRINPGLVPVYAGAVLAFTRSFLDVPRFHRRLEVLFRTLFAVCAILLVPSFLMDYGSIVHINSVLALVTVVTMAIAGIVSLRAGFRAARFFVVGFTLFIAGVLLYGLKTLGLLPANLLTHYGLQIGSVAEAVLFSLALADRISILRRDLARRLEELERAKGEIQKTARKYRSLVDGTSDMVFTLSPDLIFQTVNSAAHSILGYQSRHLVGTSFFDLLVTDPGSNLQQELTRRTLSEAIQTQKEVRLKTRLLNRQGEPRELELRFEFISDPSEPLLLGRGAPLVEDTLLRFFQSERQTVFLDQYLVNSTIVADRMTRNLVRYLVQDDADAVAICFREMLINAIEHGNLGITFDEKSRVMQEGDYLEFLLERQKDSRFAERRIRIDYALNPKRVVYRITDEGDGFDHRRMTSEASERALRDGLSHGRGIALTLDTFDVVRYNEKGNQVLLVRVF